MFRATKGRTCWRDGNPKQVMGCNQLQHVNIPRNRFLCKTFGNGSRRCKLWDQLLAYESWENFLPSKHQIFRQWLTNRIEATRRTLVIDAGFYFMLIWINHHRSVAVLAISIALTPCQTWGLSAPMLLVSLVRALKSKSVSSSAGHISPTSQPLLSSCL